MLTPVPGAFIQLWILPRTKQVSTGHLFALPTVRPSFRIPLHKQKEGHPKGVLLFVISVHFRCRHFYYAHPSTSLRMRPDAHGFSPGLKKCPPDTFLPHLRWGRPLRIPSAPPIKIPPKGGIFIGGAEGIRTLAPVPRPTRFRVTPLRPA